MPKARVVWRCQQCGHSAPKWLGRCTACGEFGTFVEELAAESSPRAVARIPGNPVPLGSNGDSEEVRHPTRSAEFDRVLGGGLVAGSLVLLGGEPGIGKSTLLLQVAHSLAEAGCSVLVASGEESARQVGMRATRIGLLGSSVQVLAEVDLGVIEATVAAGGHDVLIVDSIQTCLDPDLAGAPGSVGQVRACAARLMRMAKDGGVTTLIAGHVTKDGAIAGPRVLEHMVDTVVYFEGDRDHAFRVVRSTKNRFGPTGEVGVFEMTEAGLLPVENPSHMLLSDEASAVSGWAVTPIIEGTRPMLVEIQALVSSSYLQMPRRLATGIETSRVLQVMAVLERRAGITFAGQDVYVSTTGGVRVSEPAADLALALALSSAARDIALPRMLVAFGEVALTGELRRVGRAEARLKEAGRLGFMEALCPAGTMSAEGAPRVVECRSVADAVTALVGSA